VNSGCSAISVDLGPLMEGAEMSDDQAVADDESSRRAGIDDAFLHAVYTTVQTLEFR
jgi:hypothetical protein